MTPEDIEKAYSFDQDVRNIIAHWCGQCRYRWEFVRRLGGPDCVISLTAEKMLRQRKYADSANCKWSTYVINNSKWALSDARRDALSRQNGMIVSSYVIDELGPTIPAPVDPHQKPRRVALMIYKALGRVRNKRAAELIRRRFQEDRTMEDLGNEYGITRERVRQLCERGFTELRQMTCWNDIVEELHDRG